MVTKPIVLAQIYPSALTEKNNQKPKLKLYMEQNHNII